MASLYSACEAARQQFDLGTVCSTEMEVMQDLEGNDHCSIQTSKRESTRTMTVKQLSEDAARYHGMD
jgi:hypothetical protein